MGTTFSGASYSILEPGKVPQVSGVNRYPAQEHAGGDSKIPSIVLYDADGEVRDVGAEALQDDIQERAEDEGWMKAEWFKLHMRPRAIDPSQKLSRLPPLPFNKTAFDVFADFLRYMFKCTKTYIQETQPSGAQFWTAFADTFDLVLTHPNGWEGRQQSQMRLAAVDAGIVPDNDAGRGRVSFVTEGEASLNFCLAKGLMDREMEDEGVIIVDAGGGTIDMSAYARKSMSNEISYVEIAPARCAFQGSILVRYNAEDYLRGHLDGSKYLDSVDDMLTVFDTKTKHTFKNAKIPVYIKFGTSRDNDPPFDIKAGKLTLPGADVASFFDPSVVAIAQGVLAQREAAKCPVKTVFLVGGFAASAYLYTQLQETLGPLGIAICRPESCMNKAVAEGGVLHTLQRQVSARVARFTYGVVVSVPYDTDNAEHRKRRAKVYTNRLGDERLSGSFLPLVHAGRQVSETEEFARNALSFIHDASHADTRHRTRILRHSGNSLPDWVDEDMANFQILCTLTRDISQIIHSMDPLHDASGVAYYKFDLGVVLFFGLTEFKAQLRWEEDGVEQRSPMQVVYPDEPA